MFYLLLFFSIVTLGAGVFLAAFSVPIRETVFGSSLLISGTVAIVGGFLLVVLPPRSGPRGFPACRCRASGRRRSRHRQPCRCHRPRGPAGARTQGGGAGLVAACHCRDRVDPASRRGARAGRAAGAAPLRGA